MPKFIKVKHQVTGKTKDVTEETFKLWRPVFDSKSNQRLPNNGYVRVGEVKLSKDSTDLKAKAIEAAGNKILDKAKADAATEAQKIKDDIIAEAKREAKKITEDAKKAAEKVKPEPTIKGTADAKKSETKAK